jgi:hypothetical protein
MGFKRFRPENEGRTAYRLLCPRHVIALEADTYEDNKRHAFSRNDTLRRADNETIAIMRKRIDQLERTRKYRALQKDYLWKKQNLAKLDPESDAYQQLDEARKHTVNQMAAMQRKFQVSKSEVQKLMQEAAKDHKIPSVLAATSADHIWQGIQKVLYSNGKNIHFHKRGDLPVMRAKQINRIIVLKVDKETERLVVHMDGLDPMPLLLPKNDQYLIDEYNALLDYMEHPEVEDAAVRTYSETNNVVPVFRPCYCAIQCKKIRGKLRCFVLITIAAPPMPKKDKYGRPRVVCGNGRVGCDIGTQSAAVVSQNSVELFNLGERNQGAYQKNDKRKKFLLHKMDASRRAMNPERFNKDGTYKKGTHGKWQVSKSDRKRLYEYQELCRKEAATRLYANRETANHLLSLGNVLITEPSNTAALARKSKKKTQRSDKASQIPQKDGTTKTVHKFKKKKRFGASVLRRSPAGFQAELRKKFGTGYHEVPRMTYRASQYDFMLDEYIKKKLDERWHSLPDGRQVQRDIMSAFLLSCADDEFQSIDRNRCLQSFAHFWQMHQQCISTIIQNHLTICNSGIKLDKAV